jgi:hypothetical protein
MNCTSDLTPVSTFNTGAEVDYPIAKATLEVYRVRGQVRVLWLVRVCPCCFLEHRHGAGAGAVDPRRLLGHRAGHCRVEQRGYVLADAYPEQTAQLVAELGLVGPR